MAVMASNSDLMSDSWISPTHILPHALPDDIWSKFDVDHNKTVVLHNHEAMPDHSMGFKQEVSDHTVSFKREMPEHNMTFKQEMNFITNSNAMHGYQMCAPPTPPHSPPTEHDLDDLVASIPEILESPSATPPSDINDILSDLESTPISDIKSEVNWDSHYASWWSPIPTPTPEGSLKRDIMWGGGTCCPSLLEFPKKERQVSECSVDVALRDALRQEDEISEDEDSDDNMPDTPSGTDSDCDVDDHMSSCNSSISSPRSTNSAARYGNIVLYRGPDSTPTYVPCVNSEHNYCGRVPEPGVHVVPGIVTPSDTEDEVDVVSCNDQIDVLSNAFNVDTACPTTPTATPIASASSPSRQQDPLKISADVKRQLQARIHAMRSRQNKVSGGETITHESEESASSRFVSVKIKTQGKPAAYTKRMRDYHSEVMKSTKHRRRNRGESDEGRRSVHNSLERQRRVDLRNAFEYLRMLVPETKDLEKAPKVQILKKAALHCKQLQITEQRLLREKEKLKKHNEYLQQRSQCTSS